MDRMAGNGWQVYLLQCRDGSFYCGITNNIARRLEQHNGLRAGGARYTATRRPVRFIAAMSAPSRSEAQKLEAKVKKLPKRKKQQFFLFQKDIIVP